MKKNSKIILFVLAILFIIGIIVVLCILLENPNVKKFNEKIGLIEKSFLQKTSFNTLDEYFVIISVSDMEKQATVKVGSGSSLNSAFSDAKRKISKFIKENEYNVEWVKLDVVNSISSNFQTELENTTYAYTYRKGIIFENANSKIVLTEAELNSNELIDYENHSLNLNNLNDYLNLPSYEVIKSTPTNIKSFSTKSCFCDEYNYVYQLYDDGDTCGTRILNNIDSSFINHLVLTSSNYLFNMLGDDGKFVYGYNLTNGKKLSGYNILRHAGSVWSLIVTYDDDADGMKKQKINSALDYLKDFLTNDGNLYFVMNYEKDEIPLGAGALTILAICDYTSTFMDTQYIDLAQKIGDGILSMQQSDGHFVHTLNTDFSLKEDYKSFVYTGESIFALCKLYGATKDEKYLNAAERALQYCVNSDFSIHSDHWISYAINEISKYVDNSDFYELGLKNFTRNINNIENEETSYSTALELLMQCFKLYNTLSDKQIDVNGLSDFPIQKLTSLIKSKANSILSLYMYPETAMYLKHPSKYLGAFFVRPESFNIRIDDIQHSILSYYYFKEILD